MVQATTGREPESSRLLSHLAGSFMHALAIPLQLDNVLTSSVCTEFSQQFRSEAATTSDPVEALLLGQLAIANFAVGAMHIRAAGEPNADNAVAYSTAAARLMAETRRMAETVADIRRGGKASLQLAHVDQLNVATNGGHQQITNSSAKN